MSLTASFQIGRSALTASQLAIQVSGDNLANAATPGFTRRVANLTAIQGAGGTLGVGAGRGVNLVNVARRVDEALLARLRASTSDQAAAQTASDLFAQVESITNDLTEFGLSAELNEFVNAFSELANNPRGAETKALIVEQGVALASRLRALRSEMIDVRTQVDDQLRAAVNRAEELFGEVASLNVTIANTELGSTENVALRDQRDQMLAELSELLDVNILEQANGAVDVRVGSTPVVQAGLSRGLDLNLLTENGVLTAEVVVPVSLPERVFPTSGRIGALIDQRDGLVTKTIADLDAIAANLIFEVNRIHSSGRPFPGLTKTTSERTVPLADQTLALNDPSNATFDRLPFAAGNGSITVLVTDSATGQTTKTTIDIDLDGIDNTGAPGFADDTTLADVQAALNGVGNLSATLGPDGRISITASPGFEFGFERDSSGVLALLGVNTYFTGTGAQDVGVRQELVDEPSLLVAGAAEGSNEAALAIVDLQNRSLASLGGVSITEAWRNATGEVGVRAAAARSTAEAEGQVRASLEAQRAAVSGVSIDEESVNLLNFQRQYQAAARFISTVDQLTETLISLV
ncbi:MAG: flagellar hook-associated protein FlgK [Planctomycetota bacterium]|nr:MAG: flagellar hook-associated protein FlgK [Planctomycetota bacterium]